MVKFTKQFEAQLIPEWKEAFIDYWQLKKDVKSIHQIEPENTDIKQPKRGLWEASSNFLSSSLRKLSLLGNKQREHKPIQVHRILGTSDSKGVLYETELLEQFHDPVAAKNFFELLDLQLNKVNQFYKRKETEFIERGDSLKKQMQILQELKAALGQEHPQGSSSKEEESIPGTISYDEESITEWAEEEQGEDSFLDVLENIGAPLEDIQRPDELSESKSSRRKDGILRSLSNRVINYQGRSLRIHIPLTNPTRAFSAITYLFRDDLINLSSKKCSSGGRLHINHSRLHSAEKMIRGAYIELYKGLTYLQTYRNLNMLAFVKILKKFDKVTNQQVLTIYLKVVESSYFNSTDKVFKLTDDVEEIFVKQFAEDDRRKAMKYLKPTQREESHTITFFIGLFTGCFIALLIGYVIMAHVRGMYRTQANTIYMETVYPVLSMFSLIFLHLFMYGCNIFMWRKARINYTFIFELSATKELKYRDVFLICASSMTAIVGALFLHLLLLAKGYNGQVRVIPGLLLMASLLLLVCPLDVMYKSCRYRFLAVIRNIILSPLYKVVMLDFFMADQLCSQVPMLRNLEYVACYYITGSYKTQDYGLCTSNKNYQDLAYAVSFLPYYWRAMQCARRYFDEGHKSHLANLGKYVSAMFAAGAKVAYEKERSIGWLCLLVILSSVATVYQLYWDYVKDWGLLQANSKNPWLRDELMLRQKFIYYLSMGLNLVLRLAWLQTVFHYSFVKVDYRVTGIFLAALEILRRGHWNFYRLENEHLNNADHFRAVKTVPLPFHEVEERD